MIWKEPDAPVLEIEVADPSDYGAKHADQKLVFLRTILPFTQESLAVPYQRMVAARMFSAATESFRFWKITIKTYIRIFASRRLRHRNRSKTADELSEVYCFAIPRSFRKISAFTKRRRRDVDGG